MIGPPNDMWRVDVEGYSVSVRGEHAKKHLERINHRLAVMTLALHRIATGKHIADLAEARIVVREALEDDLPASDPRDPDHTRSGIFADHNWKCNDGKKACANGNPIGCDYPIG